MRASGMIGLLLATATPAVAAAQDRTTMASAGAERSGGDVKIGVDAWGRGDYRTAVDRWRGPAVAGDPDAQFNLGQAYKLGRGVPLDAAAAEEWFHKAALQGHFQAQDNYGLALYTAGRKSEAVPWLEKSVARGEPRGQLVLGTMLFNGDGIARDYPRAYALMTLASQQGLKSASETLAQMDQYISPTDRQRGVRLAERSTPPPRPGRPLPKPVMARGGKPMLAATPSAAPPAAGNWRIQLGAFRDQANAETLWSRVHPRLGTATPTYAKAGAVVRLQAGGYATKAAAQRACTAAGAPCVVVAPGS